MKVIKRKKSSLIIPAVIAAAFYAAALVYSVYFFAYALSAVTAVNCAFDTSSPVVTVITENRQEKTVYTYRGLLGILWRYDR